MKVLINGSSSIRSKDIIHSAIEWLKTTHQVEITEIVTAKANYIQIYAFTWAQKNKIKTHYFPEQPEEDGDDYKTINNNRMGAYVDLILAIHDGMSHGCILMVDYCKANNIKCFLYDITKF